MAATEQRKFLIIHIKNKLRGRAAQLINSRNPATYDDIKTLLNSHFGDSRDLTSLIQDLQRLKQLPGETANNFYNRLQVLNAKMLASIQKSPLTRDQKTAQISLIETMALNTLLTGLEPKLGQLIRASQPNTLLQAQSRIQRETQLAYFENQKFQRSPSQTQQKQFPKKHFGMMKCFNCQRPGHTSNQCRSQQQFPSTSNFAPRFSNNQYQPQRPFSNFAPRFPNNQPQRPSITNNTNQPPSGQSNFVPRFPNNQNQPQRPSVIQRNPNYQPRPVHCYAYPNEGNYYYSADNNNYEPKYYYDESNPENYYSVNSPGDDYYSANSLGEDYYSVNSQEDNYYNNNQSYYAVNNDNNAYEYYNNYENPNNGNFLEVPIKDHPPECSQLSIENVNSIQNLNTDPQCNRTNQLSPDQQFL